MARIRIGGDSKAALAGAFADRYGLTPDQSRQAADILIRKLAEAVTEGRVPGFFMKISEEEYEVSALMLNEVAEEVSKP